VRVLLDTHVFLWWVGGTRKLPSRAATVIRDPGNVCLLSLASIWELAIKVKLEFLESSGHFVSWISHEAGG
jgi:PIN domain nuclease of toxin-antitoxin system